ncbi:arylesterase [Flagellimonas taeanensis]|uniref:arylesterase n=1 Tax=Flagellimonas taeanensis TaxID=1005926 RepID=UPI000AB0F1D2
MCLLLMGCGGKTKEKEQDAEAVESEDTTAESNGKKILFFGDSLTAGYGLDVTDAFPSIIQEKVDSLGLDYQVVNAGLSGETTASGRNRMAWVLEDDISVVVLELGANDGLRGIPLEETRKNLQAMVDMIQEKLPQATIVLAGMQIPPNMGPEYTSGFRDIFPELAQKEDLTLIPFLLEGVAGIPELNQGDGIHPTQKGQQLVAENVWEILAEVL